MDIDIFDEEYIKNITYEINICSLSIKQLLENVRTLHGVDYQHDLIDNLINKIGELYITITGLQQNLLENLIDKNKLIKIIQDIHVDIAKTAKAINDFDPPIVNYVFPKKQQDNRGRQAGFSQALGRILTPEELSIRDSFKHRYQKRAYVHAIKMIELIQSQKNTMTKEKKWWKIGW